MAFSADSLPNTGTVPPGAWTDSLPTPTPAIAAVIALLAGLAILLRQLALRRR
jgi:hypothetical protein